MVRRTEPHSSFMIIITNYKLGWSFLWNKNTFHTIIRISKKGELIDLWGGVEGNTSKLGGSQFIILWENYF